MGILRFVITVLICTYMCAQKLVLIVGNDKLEYMNKYKR
jgi:nicotinic acid mononucleotide adenylyltransferase